ncbi:hypothetical protein GGR42_001874 [Saonia flava]|uniref:Uncharacterized protein n=1 Tax=Saonia flava TaxID=523696 RepID=A0A846QXS1_9FLAO|nr:hypothetical protein [Saonia flava]NJB71412.1 hypothetical protein [Saonia flava]
MGKFYHFPYRYVLFYMLFLVAGCSAPKSNYSKAYNEEWKKIIKSQAWYDALEPSDAMVSLDSSEPFLDVSNTGYGKTEYVSIIKSDNIFSEKYNSLVVRAYHKILTEAQKADDRLQQEYDRLNREKHDPINRSNRDFKKLLELVNKKYTAHREMLEGLKAWNIFSENRTGDLESFKEENSQEIYRRYKKEDTDDSMIAFLVYQLADLYHFED